LLAQALIHDPDIIIMDEPTANLDPKARIEFFDLLETLRKKGKAIFVSSHELAELEQYADSVTVLDGGNIVFSGKKKDFVTKIRDKRYYVQVEKNDLLSKYLTSKKIKHYFNEHEDCFVVFFKNNKQIYDLQIYMSKNKQLIQRLAFIQPTLEDMYRKFVVKGSVDTMNINKSNNVELL
jgi:ABC-2 type transport system ATP-binding protein